MLPVGAQIGTTIFTTALFPKDGSYVLPVKASVRKAEQLEADASVAVQLALT